MTLRRSYLSVAAFIIIAPAIAMLFTDEVLWGPLDFAAAAALLALGFVLIEAANTLASDRSRFIASASALCLVAAVWAHLAVGIWS